MPDGVSPLLELQHFNLPDDSGGSNNSALAVEGTTNEAQAGLPGQEVKLCSPPIVSTSITPTQVSALGENGLPSSSA